MVAAIARSQPSPPTHRGTSPSTREAEHEDDQGGDRQRVDDGAGGRRERLGDLPGGVAHALLGAVEEVGDGTDHGAGRAEGSGIDAGAHLLLDIVGGAALDVMVGEAFRVVEATLAERRRA